jgi:hypothetical protein
MTTTAVTPAAPAAATPKVSEHSSFLPEDINYRKTGQLPAVNEEESAASKKVGDEKTEDEETDEKPSRAGASAASESDTAAASEAAQQQEKPQKTAASSENRWQKLSRENRELREKNARLEGRAEGSADKRDTKQASQPAADQKTAQSTAEPKPKIDDVDPKTGKPKFATFADYEEAKDKWLADDTLRKFQETSAETQRKQQMEQAERTLSEGFAKKMQPTQKKYADFDEVALSPDLVIPRRSATEAFLLDSDHPGEVLYYLGKHPEILQGFYGDHDPKTGKFVNKLTPTAQLRELTKIELKVAAAAKDDKGDEKSSATTPAKPVTQAPPPPHQVSGKGTVGKDAVVQAVEEGDQETYNREQNARELARRKKGK